MATKVTKHFVDKCSEESQEKSVHYLPFKVEFDGDGVRVKDLFTKKAVSHPNLENVSRNTFRGRPLLGTRLELGEDYVGCVAQECVQGQEKGGGGMREESRSTSEVQIKSKFKDLTYWEWDKEPSSMDSSVKLKDWIQLANVIHEPIDN